MDLKITAGQLLISNSGTVIAIHDLLSDKYQQSIVAAHYVGLLAPKSRNSGAQRPQHDPYWQEEEVIAIRDLSVYEEAAFVGYASSAVH